MHEIKTNLTVHTQWGTYPGWGGCTYPNGMVITLAREYLLWLGVPILARGYLPWLGDTYPNWGTYLKQRRATYPGWGYLPQTGEEVPGTEQYSKYLLYGVWYASCIHAGGLSCYIRRFQSNSNV